MRRLYDRLFQYARRNGSRLGLVSLVALVATFAAARPVHAVEIFSADTLAVLIINLAGVAMYVAAFLGNLIVAVLGLVIPIMQYQGFTTSPVVNAGWAIVRDVVNMFFVVVLVVIAMQTIFGVGKVAWRQAVPKLMIFALVINFSKTLCGLMIDFAQVIMLTFANALKDIAGGNFVQLLGLGDMLALDSNAAAFMNSANGTGPGAGAVDLFAASAAAVLMMMWVLAVVVMLMFILIYRVVMLWILIVLAPLAWFVGGQSVFKSDAYSQWWQNFICYTAIGPVITFFLWLTLAVAGSGLIATQDPGLSSIAPAADLRSQGNFVTLIFDWPRLMSFVFGMAMLMVGFDAASKVCSAAKKAPGFDWLMSRGKGVPGAVTGFIGSRTRKYGGKGLSLGFKGGRDFAGGTGVAALSAVAGGGTAAERLARFKPTKAGKAARAKGLRDLSKNAAIPGFLSRRMALGADERQTELAETLKKSAEETYKGASKETKIDDLIRLANEGMILPGQEAQFLGLYAEAMKDTKMREKLDAAGVLKKLHSKEDGGLGMGDKLKDYLRGTKDYEAIDEFEASRPDISGNVNVLNDMTDVDKIDPAALARLKIEADRGSALGVRFRDRMQQVRSNTKRKFLPGEIKPDGTRVTDPAGEILTVSAWEHFEGGMGSVKKQRAWQDGMAGVYETMGKPSLDAVPVSDLAENVTPELLRRRADLSSALASDARRNVRARVSANATMEREMVNQAFGERDAAGALTGNVDAAKIRTAVRNDSNAVKNLSDRVMTGDLATAVGNAYANKSVLQKLIMDYRTALPDARREMDLSTIENVFVGLDAARADATASGRTREAAEITRLEADLVTQLEAVEGGNTRMLTELSGLDAALSAEEMPLIREQIRLSGIATPNPQQARRLAEVTDRLGVLREEMTRIATRIARH